jgi:hypothetical protein
MTKAIDFDAGPEEPNGFEERFEHEQDFCNYRQHESRKLPM